MLTRHLYIGGPLDGQRLNWEEYLKTSERGYSPFNCGCRLNRSKSAKERAAAKGEVIPPSCIYIHYSFFVEDMTEVLRDAKSIVSSRDVSSKTRGRKSQRRTAKGSVQTD